MERYSERFGQNDATTGPDLGVEPARPEEQLPAPTTDTPLLDTVAPPAPPPTGPQAAAPGPAGPLNTTGDVYRKHQEVAAGADLDTTGFEWSVRRFQEVWTANQHRYQTVADATGVPAALVAAIHFRESTGNFNTYLHQGDPLGQAAVNHPSDIPIFYDWESAAIHALQMKDSIRRDIGLTADSTDLAGMLTFAEYYNGLGYNNRGVASPYVYSGTDAYTSGKYVRDRVYDPNTVDQQLGVYALMQSIDTEFTQTAPVGPAPQRSTAASRSLRQSHTGSDVRALQTLLNQNGAQLEVDGVFGRATDAAVRAYQREHGLEVDGIAGPQTMASLRGEQAPAPEWAAEPGVAGDGPTSGGEAAGPAPEGLAAERAALAARSARIEFTEGVAAHGAGTWETQGSNNGPEVDQYKTTNHAGADADLAWCGMFVGYNYQKAGIRTEILRNLVFWSGYRLHEFFTSGTYVSTNQARAGDWWTNHRIRELSGTGDDRKTQLDAYAPQPGDVVLFREDYSHVGMVASYDAATGNLQLLEGNRGNRVQATAYGTGDDTITFIGRFNDADFEPGGQADAGLVGAQDPTVRHTAVSGGTR